MTTALPAISEMMRALVAAPSVSSANPALDQGNQGVIEALATWLGDGGFRVEVLPVPGHPGKANLIATLGEGPGGLVLSGHTDTVPYDTTGWTHDPFMLTERHGRLYGLGICDMKGFLAIAAHTAAHFPKTRIKRPLILLATADEESTMCGAKALVAAARALGRHAVIGEPTSLKPAHLHKGMLMEAIRLTGKSGHSSDPALGVNALDGMYRVMGELMAWRKELAGHRDDRFAVPFPTLNLGHIHGGDNPNRICGACELHIDLRFLPGMEMLPLREALYQRVRAALSGSGLIVSFDALFDGMPPLATDAHAAVVRAAEELTGHPAGSVTFGTEGPFLSRLGMETVILGPGDIGQAHQPDEFLAIDRIAPTIRLLEGFITRFCTTPGD